MQRFAFSIMGLLAFILITTASAMAQQVAPPALPQANNIQNEIPAFQDTTNNAQQTTTAPQTTGTVPAPNPEEIDPCAAYMNHYDIYTVCQDRIQKIQRMKDSKSKRAKNLQPRLTQQQKMQQKAREEAELKAKAAAEQAAQQAVGQQPETQTPATTNSPDGTAATPDATNGETQNPTAGK